MKQVIPPDAWWAVLIMSLVLLVQRCNYPGLTKCQSYQIRGLFVTGVLFFVFFNVLCVCLGFYFGIPALYDVYDRQAGMENMQQRARGWLSLGLECIWNAFGMHWEKKLVQSKWRIQDSHMSTNKSLLSGAACCELHCLSSCLECLWERVSLTKACFRYPLSKVLRP